jgi:hypothetical protein
MTKAQKEKVVALAIEGEIQVLLLSPEAVVFGESLFALVDSRIRWIMSVATEGHIHVPYVLCVAGAHPIMGISEVVKMDSLLQNRLKLTIDWYL